MVDPPQYMDYITLAIGWIYFAKIYMYLYLCGHDIGIECNVYLITYSRHQQVLLKKYSNIYNY